MNETSRFETRRDAAVKRLAQVGPFVKGTLVPVGEDQVSHVELTREVARHFNFLYRERLTEPLFPEPQVLLTPTSKMPGLDGRKMSKSYHNTISLREDPKSVEQKIKTMVVQGFHSIKPGQFLNKPAIDPGNIRIGMNG